MMRNCTVVDLRFVLVDQVPAGGSTSKPRSRLDFRMELSRLRMASSGIAARAGRALAKCRAFKVRMGSLDTSRRRSSFSTESPSDCQQVRVWFLARHILIAREAKQSLVAEGDRHG